MEEFVEQGKQTGVGGSIRAEAFFDVATYGSLL